MPNQRVRSGEIGQDRKIYESRVMTDKKATRSDSLMYFHIAEEPPAQSSGVAKSLFLRGLGKVKHSAVIASSRAGRAR